MELLNVTKKNDHLLLDISGTACRFHFLWLRDNGPECRSPNSQRLHESNSIDPAIRPRSFSHSNNELNIVGSYDAKSAYPLELLTAWAYDRPSEQTDCVILWNKEIGDRIHRHDYREVCADPAALRSWLQDVERYGFSLLKNVPPVEETIFDVVGLFGFVRETNYGRFFEVRAEENASDLAYTPAPLSVHSDNPYRDPCPTLQLLHCLVQADQRGITAVADGFNAADKLRREAPGAFMLLSETDVSFHYESDDAILDNNEKIITLDASGRCRRIRINNRSMAPLRLDFDLVLPFYQALFKFRSILENEESQFHFQLQRGDLLLLDNERVLHGRIGHSVGARHLQGCYADRDGLLSTLRVLEKSEV